MTTAVSSLLSKVAELKRQAIKQQPVDPLADLTPLQRKYYEQWWQRFRFANQSTPESFYAAVISRQGWTPNCMLDRPKVTNSMTLRDCADLYRDQLGKKLMTIDTILQIFSPKPFVLAHDWNNIYHYVWLSDYRKKYGKTKSQEMVGDRQSSLKFSTVESPCALRMEKDAFGKTQHAITGKGLVQLMMLKAMSNAPERPDVLTVKPSDAASFFEGHDLDLAVEFLERKLSFIVDPALPATPDDFSRHAATDARNVNGETWKILGAIPQNEPLPEPKPLPFNGTYNLLEMVEHDKQTGLLERAMLERMTNKV